MTVALSRKHASACGALAHGIKNEGLESSKWRSCSEVVGDQHKYHTQVSHKWSI